MRALSSIRRRPLTPAEQFGDELRRERERAGVSLETIAQRTNIKISHFKALERGDCSRWPPGVYSRAFLRRYAGAVGLDPEHTLAEAAQFFSNFRDEALPLSAQRPELKHELRMQLDLQGRGPDWRQDWHRWARAVGVVVFDVSIAVMVGAMARAAGGDFWMVLTGVLALYYAIVTFRAAKPRSLFLLMKATNPPELLDDERGPWVATPSNRTLHQS
jgi:transcriptional regulator with XRE-family HTH domain